MKEKFAIALVIYKDNSKILFCKRTQNLAEYKNIWSLPSKSVSKEEYTDTLLNKSLSNDLASKITMHKIGVKSKGSNFLINVRRDRGEYILNMCLCSATIDGDLYINPTYYSQYEYFKPLNFLKFSKNIVGTCISVLCQYLIKIGKLSRLATYIEIPPLIADSGREINSYSDEELWKISALNYCYYLNKDQDGTILKSAILDSFFKHYLKVSLDNESEVLDLGCGNGALLKIVGQYTQNYFGLEQIDILSQLSLNVPNEKIKIGDIKQATEIFSNKKFDFIILNLVIQWIDNLDELILTLSTLLKKGGKVIVTYTVHFLKFGEFKKNSPKNYVYIINQNLRVKKKLTMISRNVGPLWIYPRQTFEILNRFSSLNFKYKYSEDLYLDSYLDKKALDKMILSEDNIKRHLMIPLFSIIVFEKGLD